MKLKTSITLPVTRRAGRVDENRSAPLERAAFAYLEGRDGQDIEIINRNAKRLNREALDTLGYQRIP